MSRTMEKLKWRGLLLAGLTILAWLPPAVQADDLTTVTVKVTVLAAPSCVINGNRPIEVDFGEMLTTGIDGDSYRTAVNYTLSCADGSPNALKLQVQGNTAAFDAALLQTSSADLGIRLQQGSTPLPLNSWLDFSYPQTPQLWATPVKKTGATLTGGEFSAAATMRVDYR